MTLWNTYWLSKKLDVLHCISGNHDAQQHLCSFCYRALMKFSILLFPCSRSPCDWEWPGASSMKLDFPGQSITKAAMMLLANSDPLLLWMILGNPWKHMYFDFICNYSCFFGHQWKYYVEFRKMINSVTYIAILTVRLTLHINQIDLKFQESTTFL